MFAAAILCLLLVGVFAGAETVLVSANRIRFHRRVATGARRARAVRDVLAEPRAALSTSLAATAICTVLTVALASVASERRWGTEAAAVSAAVQMLAILVIGEVVPNLNRPQVRASGLSALERLDGESNRGQWFCKPLPDRLPTGLR